MGYLWNENVYKPNKGSTCDVSDNYINAKKSKQSGKEKANNVPDWAKGNKPNSNENGKDFVKRLLDSQYGKGNWEGTGPGSDFNRLKKWGDRGFK